MNLVASVMCRNELGRYLEPCINHLFEFCDTVVAYDDGSDDGSVDFLLDAGCHVAGPPENRPMFFEHEGRARQILLDAVLEEQPTFVLAIDADEFISDGQALRQELMNSGPVRSLCMQEIWGTGVEMVMEPTPGQITMSRSMPRSVLQVRWDGAWCPHEVPIVWSPQAQSRRGYRNTAWTMGDYKLACPRTPTGVRLPAGYTGVSILHFGWTNVQQRQARYDRYVEHDKGKHHNIRHLNSIMYGEHQIQLKPLEWPEALEPYRGAIMEAANRQQVEA